jgi:hypothetical protein
MDIYTPKRISIFQNVIDGPHCISLKIWRRQRPFYLEPVYFIVCKKEVPDHLLICRVGDHWMYWMNTNSILNDQRGHLDSIILGRSSRDILTIELNIPVLTKNIQRSPTFGKSYSSWNILTRFVQKNPNFGKFYSNKNIDPLAPGERLLTSVEPLHG